MSAVILRKTWPSSIRSAVLQVVSLGQFALARTRGWAANSINARVRLKAGAWSGVLRAAFVQ